MDYSYIFRRQHPDYTQNLSSWNRCLAAYSGGAEYISQALIQHVSEVDLEFLERQNRAYYFNYPRKIARLITQYLLAHDPARFEAAPEIVEDFSRNGMRANEVMRQFSTILNIFGSAWMLVEMPNFDGTVDPERQKQEKLRPYAMVLSPLAVVDWAMGSDGKLLWALIEEDFFDNSNAFTEPVSSRRRRLWQRDSWQLFEEKSGEVKLISQGENKLGTVPLLHVAETDGTTMRAKHWFDDVVRISDAILNNESEAQMNIIKQMFGLLVISENFARGSRPAVQSNSDSAAKFSHILARSAAIWESSEESGISRYISPNGAATNIIRSENKNLKAELFDVIGLSIVRETNEMQSAESKAWDHRQVSQFLLNRVDMLEHTELAAWQLMHSYDPTVVVPQIAYNRDFAVVDLHDSIAGLLDLNTLNAGNEFKKEIIKTAVSLLNKYQKIAPERQQAIIDELDSVIKTEE